MKYTNIGSISSGTMREQDLIPCFLDALREFDEKRSKNIEHEIQDTLWEAWVNGADPSDVLGAILNEDLFGALDEHSPPYFYFGAHEGDGSDYGWWFSEDSVDATFEGLKVDDLSEVPDDYSGEVLVTTDHGNLSLYLANGKGNLEELWGIG